MTRPTKAGLTEAEKESLWDSIDRAFLDTSTFGRSSEEAIERVVERIAVNRVADAWDEGYVAGCDDGHDHARGLSTGRGNPHQTEDDDD